MSRTHRSNLRSLTTEATSKLDVLGLDGNTLGMDSAQVGVLKERDKVSLNGLLKSTDGGALESEVALEILFKLFLLGYDGRVEYLWT